MENLPSNMEYALLSVIDITFRQAFWDVQLILCYSQLGLLESLDHEDNVLNLGETALFQEEVFSFTWHLQKKWDSSISIA